MNRDCPPTAIRRGELNAQSALDQNPEPARKLTLFENAIARVRFDEFGPLQAFHSVRLQVFKHRNAAHGRKQGLLLRIWQIREFSFILHRALLELRKIFMDKLHRDRALPHCGRDPLHASEPYIPRDEDAWNTGFQ
jgi:hypothetical protein